MKKFEIGKKYSMVSPCQYSCTWEYKVVSRTEKMITLEATESNHSNKKCRLKIENGEEYCYPLGRYSMCPVLRAGR